MEIDAPYGIATPKGGQRQITERNLSSASALSDTSRAAGPRCRVLGKCPAPRVRPPVKGDGPRDPRVTVLVAVLASADPGELLTWTQLEELADAALASRMDIGRSCRCGRAVGRPVTGPSPPPDEPTSGDRHQGHLCAPPHGDHVELQAAGGLVDHSGAG